MGKSFVVPGEARLVGEHQYSIGFVREDDTFSPVVSYSTEAAACEGFKTSYGGAVEKGALMPVIFFRTSDTQSWEDGVEGFVDEPLMHKCVGEMGFN